MFELNRSVCNMHAILEIVWRSLNFEGSTELNIQALMATVAWYYNILLKYQSLLVFSKLISIPRHTLYISTIITWLISTNDKLSNHTILTKINAKYEVMRVLVMSEGRVANQVIVTIQRCGNWLCCTNKSTQKIKTHIHFNT